MKKIQFILSVFFFFTYSFGFCRDVIHPVEEFQLSNGMKWLFINRPYAPVFSGAIAIRAGGVDERSGKSGIAHMFEHMAFKGSKKYPDADEITRLIELNGGLDLNAYTSKDTTVYHVSLPNNKLELFADLFSEMVFNPVFKDFYVEKNVILAERKSSIDNNPYGLTFKTIVETAYESGPFSWMTIGVAEDIEKLTIDDILNYFSTYYSPNNIYGILVGDFSSEHAKAVITKYFGSKKSRKLPPAPEPSVPRKGRTVEIRTFANPAVAVAFHKPAHPHPDSYAFDVLSFLLCDGMDSRLESRLIYKKKLASTVYCTDNFPDMRQDNLMVIYVEPVKGVSPERILKELRAELNRVKVGEISKRGIEKIQHQISLRHFMMMEKNQRLADLLVSYQATFGDWKMAYDYPVEIEKVGEKEIKGLFDKYMKDEDMITVFRRQGEGK